MWDIFEVTHEDTYDVKKARKHALFKSMNSSEFNKVKPSIMWIRDSRT